MADIWITDEIPARCLIVKGRSAIDPDCLVAHLENDSRPLWIVDGGEDGKTKGAYVCGLGGPDDHKVRARRINLAPPPRTPILRPNRHNAYR